MKPKKAPQQPGAAGLSSNNNANNLNNKVVTAEVLRVPSAGRRVIGGELP